MLKRSVQKCLILKVHGIACRGVTVRVQFYNGAGRNKRKQEIGAMTPSAHSYCVNVAPHMRAHQLRIKNTSGFASSALPAAYAILNYDYLLSFFNLFKIIIIGQISFTKSLILIKLIHGKMSS